jgi:hypothetical protein
MPSSFKFINNYDDYKESSSDRHKVQWLKVYKVSAKTESKVIAELTDIAKNELYDVYFFNDNLLNDTLKRSIDKIFLF